MPIVSYLKVMESGNFAPSYVIPKNTYGRQLVIPDIHACAKTFKALIAKVQLKKQDHLFLLGDYINKGPDNVGVIDYILKLLEEGYQVFPLRGNHEDMLLASHYTALHPEYRRVPTLQKRRGIVDKNRRILPKYQAFFSHLPYFYELENYFLVHAGFNLQAADPFRDYESMLWLPDFQYEKPSLAGKNIIVGHVTELLQFIQEDIVKRAPLIHLDNGAYKTHYMFKGNLLCLNLDSFELLIQENIETE